MKSLHLTCFLFLSLLIFFPVGLYSQRADSTLLGRDVFDLLEESGPKKNHIVIVQSDATKEIVNEQILQNATSPLKIKGFRVRIFFDNKQSARGESTRIAAEFSEVSPGTAIYSDYDNPYFKVTVGDFRTKSDAMRFMNSIKALYPQAFITREYINYPVL